MSQIKIGIDVEAAIKLLNDVDKKQVPFAKRQAVNAVAKSCVAALQAEMRAKLDRPTPWTLGAFYAKLAKTKRDPEAWIGAREFAGKGRPAITYLNPEIYGGSRAMKGFELKLRALSGGQYVMPTANTRLDRYGNISPGQMTKILSQLGMLDNVGQSVSAKTTARLQRQKLIAKASGNRGSFFVGRSKEGANGRPLGIFQLVGKGTVKMVLAFVSKKPSYKARFDFEKTVWNTVVRNGAAEFSKALAQAIATAKPGK